MAVLAAACSSQPQPAAVSISSRLLESPLFRSPDPDGNENQKNREGTLELHCRELLREPRAEVRSEEQPNRNQPGRTNVEVPRPIIRPRPERAHWQQQCPERRPGCRE